MSSKEVGSRLGRRTRSAQALIPRRGYYVRPGSGLLHQPQITKYAGHRRKASWLYGRSNISHVPAVRGISFARVLPQLAFKLIRVPAMFGGAAIAGLAYIQYQAQQAGGYAMDVLRQGSEKANSFAEKFLDQAKQVAEQTRNGFQRTKDEAELPSWLQSWFSRSGSRARGGDSLGPNGQDPRQSRAGTAAAGATAAAFGIQQSPGDDERPQEEVAKDEHMMDLTKKMIEIRGMLREVDQSENLTLPSIVVIGSQSSGKSSVLEAIVGHEFLPKGDNMVTRRPIEMTLVNTPNSREEYGEIDAEKISDFEEIQRRLTRLNLEVPQSVCVSDDPIQLKIYSPSIPDLSLIDLPGYIQVIGANQPKDLEQKIRELCDRYIRSPNIILAISPADVDLANSAAIRASKLIDPRGQRTIGVITKMDLVDPARGRSMLSNPNYRLREGYVGVVSRIPQRSTSFFSRNTGNLTSAITKNEMQYFSEHPEDFGPQSQLMVGTTTLRKKLTEVLEQAMSSRLEITRKDIRGKLAQTNKRFYRQYNNEQISPQWYLNKILDAFKHRFEDFADGFRSEQVEELTRAELDQKVLEILSEQYWNEVFEKPSDRLDSLSNLNEVDSRFAENKVQESSALLTRLGIGDVATDATMKALASEIENLLASSAFVNHPLASDIVRDATAETLSSLRERTSEIVETRIKPYKRRPNVQFANWATSRKRVMKLLEDEGQLYEAKLKALESHPMIESKRQLQDIMTFVERTSKQEKTRDSFYSGSGGYTDDIVTVGCAAVFLQDRINYLRRRRTLISKQCSNPGKPPLGNAPICPEVFLDLVAEKLTMSSTEFLEEELLEGFYKEFPRQLDARFTSLGPEDIETLVSEDPNTRNHWDIIKRKQLLERVLEEMERLRPSERR